MTFTITSDFNLDPVIFKDVSQLLIRIGKILSSNIQLRTLNRGIDASGLKFKPYTKEYREYKTARGGNPTPDLKSVRKVSEHMVESVDTVKASRRSVEVGVSGFNLRKAVYNENMGRSFLGYYPVEDDKDIDPIVNTWVEEQLERNL